MATITEDYCSFEIAKLLKDKGFNEHTICKYAGEGGITERYYDDYRERVLRFDWKEGYLIEPLITPKEQYEIIGDTISAPSQAMAMKWLRKKGIYITIVYGDYPSLNKVFWTPQIDSLEGFDLPIDFYKEYDKYEEACEAAIKYCLENLI